MAKANSTPVSNNLLKPKGASASVSPVLSDQLTPVINELCEVHNLAGPTVRAFFVPRDLPTGSGLLRKAAFLLGLSHKGEWQQNHSFRQSSGLRWRSQS